MLKNVFIAGLLSFVGFVNSFSAKNVNSNQSENAPRYFPSKNKRCMRGINYNRRNCSYCVKDDLQIKKRRKYTIEKNVEIDKSAIDLDHRRKSN